MNRIQKALELTICKWDVKNELTRMLCYDDCSEIRAQAFLAEHGGGRPRLYLLHVRVQKSRHVVGRALRAGRPLNQQAGHIKIVDHDVVDEP
jgi:hypothetical protein